MNKCSKELIVFMGVSGCGKSSIGQRIANEKNYLFVDADDFHADDSKKMMAIGKAISDEQRIPWVTRIIAFLQSKEQQYDGVVLAFSGIKSAHRALFRQLPYQCRFFWLSPKLELLQQRLESRQQHFATALLLPGQLSSFEKPLQNETDITQVDNNKNIEQTIKNVLTLLSKGVST